MLDRDVSVGLAVVVAFLLRRTRIGAYYLCDRRQSNQRARYRHPDPSHHRLQYIMAALIGCVRRPVPGGVGHSKRRAFSIRR